MKILLNILFVGTGVLALGLTAAGIGGGYFRVIEPGVAFMLFVAGMLVGVAASIAGLVDAARKGFSARSIGILMGIGPACALVYLGVDGRGYPMINDVTTDLVYPPAFVYGKTVEENAERDMDFPLDFKEDIESNYADLIPKAMIMSVDDAYFMAMDIVKGTSNWEVTANRIGEKESFIEGTVTSAVFGFKDDFVIRISAAGSGGCVVDMRSKSRLGKGDFGQNAAHIRDFMAHIK